MGFQAVLAGAIRVILFGLNFCTLLAGGVLLGCGAYVKISIEDFVKNASSAEAVEVVAYMLIGMGCLVVVLSLVGCLGACLQNHHILACYFVLMLMLILLEIAIGILYAVKKKPIERQIEDYIKDTVESYGDGTSSEDIAVDAVQTLLKCCGYEGPLDYTIGVLPDSCCEGEPIACNTVNARTNGCKKEIEKLISSQSVLVIIVVCAVLLLEMTTMLAACYLRRRELSDIDFVISDPPYSI